MAIVTLDPSHAYESGLEDQSGKEDTKQFMIAVLMFFFGFPQNL